MSIKPDYFTFDDLLQKRLFRIAEYQRAYSWEKKQRDDLFSDIIKLSQHKDDRHHFMATIVCLKRKKQEIGVDEHIIYDIVDGQQRLTTLIILLKAIAKKLLNGNKTENKEAEKLEELLIKGDERLILLQTNHDSSFLFRSYLKSGKIPEQNSLKTLADKNLFQAFKECENFVTKWNNDPLSLLKLIKNRLAFIFYVLEEEGAVYTIFEVLNSRGLEVDWLDKCKSMLMGIAFEKFKPEARSEHIKELHKFWEKIYRTIGIRKIPGHQILRFAATFKHPDSQSKILSAEKSLEFFREYCERNPKSILEVTQSFLKIADKLEQLYGSRRLGAVTNIIHARFLATAILLKDSFTEDEKKQILEQWEKVTFRIFGLFRKDARTKVGDYTRLAQEIFLDNLKRDKIIAKISLLGEDHPIENAIEQLRYSDCYNGWENELRYLLYRYEENLAKEQGANISEEIWEQIWSVSPTNTIEHIYPQNPGIEWRGKLGKGKNKIENNVNRLGNLMLLPPDVNLKAGRKSFVEKKKIYRKHNNLKLINEVLSKRDWNIKSIEERVRCSGNKA